MAGLTAAVGGASGWNSFWGANTIQKLLLSLLAPVIVAAHLNFPSVSFPRYRNRIVTLVFVVAVSLSLWIAIDDWILKPRGDPAFVSLGIPLRQAALAFFALSWIMAIVLLIRNRFLSPHPEIRRRTGIIIWGMVLGIGPFFLLTLLPYILFGKETVAGAYTILPLLLLPLAYAFVIFQRKLLKVDFIVNRILVWFVLILLVLILSIIIFSVLGHFYQLPVQIPIFGGLVAVLIALSVTSLSKVVQVQVDQILYGSHYDFATVTSSLSNRLAQPLDRKSLVELLTQHFPQQMGIQRAALLLAEGTRLRLESPEGDEASLEIDDAFCKALTELRYPVRASKGLKTPCIDVQSNLKEFDWGQVYAPLIVENKLQGILILGPRVSGDVYSDQDLKIIATVAEQSALAATNLMLVEKLRGLAQQLVRSEEEQRKRLASDLHDSVLQDLFIIKQKLLKETHDPKLLDDMDDVFGTLRQMIRTQRPPMLDGGLPLALEGLVKDMQRRTDSSTMITWKNHLQGSFVLNDEQATSIFRIAQEALNNAIKHAHAQQIDVSLERTSQGMIRLQVIDDGIGASGAKQNGNMDQNHFGLLLMNERATMINAALNIHTQLGEGTAIVLEVNP
jgi:two-component system sensor histidine kinase ComP